MNARTLGWVRDVFEAREDTLVATNVEAGSDRSWLGAVVDSRAECSGRLFFAIRGERTDGHRYVESAHGAGAVAAVVDRPASRDSLESAGIPFFLVNDTVPALQMLARVYRDHLDARVVAITGSAGKTTTKEYIRAALRTTYRTQANPGNYNSLIGVPITVLETDPDTEYLVCELGANATGEIDTLAHLVRPVVGVITNIGDAHVGEFGSRDAIAAAKGELLDHVEEGGRVVLPRRDEYFDALRARARSRVVSFGVGEGADYVVSDVHPSGEGLAFEVNGEAYMVPAMGRYNALNACAAIAVGEACGVDAERMRTALAGAHPLPGRGRVFRARGITVIDESYNASPRSMVESLTMLSEVPAKRRIAVLGDMAELGKHADAGHERVGAHISGLGLDVVVWIGSRRDAVTRGLGESPSADVLGFDDADAFASRAADIVADGDAVLVKASRACGLDRVVDLLVHGTEREGRNA